MNYLVKTYTALLQHSAIKFGIVGIINTLLSLIIIFSLKAWCGFGDVTANFTGYIAGLLCSFFLNKRWTFKQSGNLIPTFIRFLLIFAASYLLNIITVLMLIHAGTNGYLAQIAGMPIYTIAFYIGSRYFVFAK